MIKNDFNKILQGNVILHVPTLTINGNFVYCIKFQVAETVLYNYILSKYLKYNENDYSFYYRDVMIYKTTTGYLTLGNKK